MNSRFFKLFRALIPSWRFFETLGAQPVLYYRTAGRKEDLGEWLQALKRPPRPWYAMALNGEGNLNLACYSLLDQLEDDIGELDPSRTDSFPQMPSYQLVQNLVCFVLRERRELQAGHCYQFKVCRELGGSAEEFLVSPVHTL